MRREAKVGAVVLIALIALFYGFNYLKGSSVFSTARTFYAEYASVSGLEPDNVVMFQGLKVGKVENIFIEPGGGHRLIVEFFIDDGELTIPSNSVARITSLDILGSKVLTIDRGDSPSLAEVGDTLTGGVDRDLADAVDERLAPLEEKTQELIVSIDSVADDLHQILDAETGKNLTASIENIKETFENFKAASVRINRIMAREDARIASILASADSVTNMVSMNRDTLAAIFANFKAISDSLAESDLRGTVDNADSTLGELALMLDTINSGEGSLGKLIYDDSLYVNINLLMEDIRKRPWRYVRFSVFGGKGKKDKNNSGE